MNFRYEWTVFRETMSFYGVTHNRLAISRGGRRCGRSCHSLDLLRASRGRPSDRGMVHPPVPDREMEPQVEAHSQSESSFDPASSRRHPFPPGVGSPRGITVHHRFLEASQKSQQLRDKESTLS